MRTRKQEYVTSERSKAFADLLFECVCELDSGTPAFELTERVSNIARAMG